MGQQEKKQVPDITYNMIFDKIDDIHLYYITCMHFTVTKIWNVYKNVVFLGVMQLWRVLIVFSFYIFKHTHAL